MNKFRTYLFIFLLAFIHSLRKSQAQKSSVLFEQEKFDAHKLNTLIIEKINQFRLAQNLPPLQPHKSLNKAAEDHNEYLQQTNRITSIQPSPDKATPLLRSKYYHGLFSNVEELEQIVPLGKKVKLAGSSTTKIYSSYTDITEGIIESWTYDEKLRSLLGSPYFFHYGISSAWKASLKTIYVCLVLANQEYHFFDISQAQWNNFKVKPFHNNECKTLLKEYSYLPALLSENIILRNDSAFFYFHDKALLQRIFDKKYDGIAADFLLKEQFDCRNGITLFPSDIHKGLMLKPLYRNKLFQGNLIPSPNNEILVFLGKIPPGYTLHNSEINLLLIKNRCLCNTVMYNNLGGKNLHLLNLELALDTFAFSNHADTNIQTLTFTIPFSKGKAEYTPEDIKPFLDSLKVNRYYIKEISITAYSSLEGDSLINEQLQRKRAESIMNVLTSLGFQHVQKKISTQENWAGFFESISGSPYESFFKRLTRQAIRDVINSDTLHYNLEPYLEDQRKADIVLLLEKIKIDSLVYQQPLLHYKKSIRSEDIVYAKALQSLLLHEILNKNIPFDSLQRIFIPNTPSMADIANNHLVLLYLAAQQENKPDFRRNLLQQLLALKLAHPDHPYVLYNYYLLQLEEWANNFNLLNDPEKLLKEIKKLYNTRIENWRINRLIMNFSIIAADYYYEKNDFEKREKYLKEAKKYLLQSQLEQEQTMQIADYFLFQMRTEWVIEVLKPWIQNNLYTEDMLLTYLKTALYHPALVPEKTFLSLMEQLKNSNPQKFCQLFGYPQMSFQLLENQKLLQQYCQICNP